MSLAEAKISFDTVKESKLFDVSCKVDELQTPPLEVLRYKRLSPNAVPPRRATPGSAGYDLSAAEPKIIPARGKALVKTDLAIGLPPGTCAQVCPRSGLALKHDICAFLGTIDEDYKFNIGVILYNFSDTDFIVNVGDRIAQLVIQKIATPEAIEVDELGVTERKGGFGSTGI